MNTRIRHILALAVPALMLAVTASAHDPREHEKEARKPDCAAMSGMDHSKMDMNDPVMKALHDKCEAAHAAHPSGHDTGGSSASPKDAKPATSKAPDAHGSH